MTQKERFARAANIAQLNRLLKLAGREFDVVQRSAQGECFWMKNGPIMASGTFYYVRNYIAEIMPED